MKLTLQEKTRLGQLKAQDTLSQEESAELHQLQTRAIEAGLNVEEIAQAFAPDEQAGDPPAAEPAATETKPKLSVTERAAGILKSRETLQQETKTAIERAKQAEARVQELTRANEQLTTANTDLTERVKAGEELAAEVARLESEAQSAEGRAAGIAGENLVDLATLPAASSAEDGKSSVAGLSRAELEAEMEGKPLQECRALKKEWEASRN